MIQKDIKVKGADILIMGIIKENCPMLEILRWWMLSMS